MNLRTKVSRQSQRQSKHKSSMDISCSVIDLQMVDGIKFYLILTKTKGNVQNSIWKMNAQLNPQQQQKVKQFEHEEGQTIAIMERQYWKTYFLRKNYHCEDGMREESNNMSLTSDIDSQHSSEKHRDEKVKRISKNMVKKRKMQQNASIIRLNQKTAKNNESFQHEQEIICKDQDLNQNIYSQLQQNRLIPNDNTIFSQNNLVLLNQIPQKQAQNHSNKQFYNKIDKSQASLKIPKSIQQQGQVQDTLPYQKEPQASINLSANVKNATISGPTPQNQETSYQNDKFHQDMGSLRLKLVDLTLVDHQQEERLLIQRECRLLCNQMLFKTVWKKYPYPFEDINDKIISSEQLRKGLAPLIIEVLSAFWLSMSIIFAVKTNGVNSTRIRYLSFESLNQYYPRLLLPFLKKIISEKKK